MTQLLVVTTAGDGVATLRRMLPPDASLLDLRSIEEMWLRLDRSLGAVVVLELTRGGAEQMLATLVRLNGEAPRAIPIVLAERSMAHWEAVCREAGAAHFVSSPRQMHEVVSVVQTQQVLEDRNRTVDDESASIEARILATLPWGE